MNFRCNVCKESSRVSELWGTITTLCCHVGTLIPFLCVCFFREITRLAHTNKCIKQPPKHSFKKTNKKTPIHQQSLFHTPVPDAIALLKSSFACFLTVSQPGHNQHKTTLSRLSSSFQSELSQLYFIIIIILFIYLNCCHKEQTSCVFLR